MKSTGSSAKRSTRKTENSSPKQKPREIDRLKRAIDWCLNDSGFGDLKVHGNAKWSAKFLIVLAVLSAWGTESRMTDCFAEASKLSMNLYGTVAINTYQGMMRALLAYTGQLLPIVWLRLQAQIEKASPKNFRIGRWLALAVDGSRFTTPRTKSNEQAFAAKNYGKGKQAKSRAKWKNKNKRSKKLSTPVKPQIWLTLVWHMGSKLPWCWKSGPSNSSERSHLVEMIETMIFPKNTLFCGDAGFTGYEFWSAIIESGNNFLVRVGGNVKLLKNLGHCRTGDGIVSLWPDAAARRKQPPILLRLIEVKNERGTMYLVTSVLNQRQLSDSMLKRLYPLRWGIELQFRALKQTFGLAKLRSRNSGHAIVELNWSIVALTMVELLAVKEQSQIEIPPEHSSVSAALQAIRQAMRHWFERNGENASLDACLAAAIKDKYERTTRKEARYKPNFKDKPADGKPVVIAATLKQKRAYNALQTAA